LQVRGHPLGRQEPRAGLQPAARRPPLDLAPARGFS